VHHDHEGSWFEYIGDVHDVLASQAIDVEFVRATRSTCATADVAPGYLNR
jgi:hypothetical protein